MDCDLPSKCVSACHPSRESWARGRHLFQMIDERLRVKVSSTKQKRGSFEGAVRIPLHALLFLFKDLAFLRIPSKSLKFRLLLSIPTTPPTIFNGGGVTDPID